ncbi:MAG TPA: DUF1810 domain-containing protein [Oscillospiraceae bacterium]|nr:DUF1810 domain-containing protein [Oscillospiraceae bacterium]
MGEYDLSRFRKAQQDSYQTALAEIRRGRKFSHWMWYIFPQINGLGMSPTAQYYAIRDLDEAREYLADPVLGERLIEISQALLELPGGDADYVFGWPDNLKLRSSMTLFSLVSPDNTVFRDVLDKYYGGEPDRATLSIVGRA